MGKGGNPLLVATRLASESCAEKTLQRLEVANAVRGKIDNPEALLSRMKVRIVGQGEEHLVVAYFGGFDNVLDARNIAMGHGLTCVRVLETDEKSGRQGKMALCTDELQVLRGVLDTKWKEIDEIRREMAVPQIAERENQLGAQIVAEQKEMQAYTVRAEELTRHLEILKKAVAKNPSQPAAELPDLRRQAAQHEDVRTVRAAIVKRQVELVEARGEGQANEKLQAMEKQLSGLQMLLKETQDRIANQMASDAMEEAESELGRIRARMVTLTSLFRNDQATARDLVERQAVLERRMKDVEDMRAKMTRLDDELRRLNLLDRGEMTSASYAGEFDLTARKGELLPLNKAEEQKKPHPPTDEEIVPAND
ncbi:MAG: hypothetical protein NTV86_23380 [Planctomycetota bacterium]|nr:hypothetical protein [Planctomycetota bacterium]